MAALEESLRPDHAQRMLDLAPEEQGSRIWRILPGALDHAPALRAQLIARRMALPLDVTCERLEDLRHRGLAAQSGGWWRRRGVRP